MIAPDRSYFGEKDFQQLVVVGRMVSDLRLGTEIVACPTVREADACHEQQENSYFHQGRGSRAALIHLGLARPLKRPKGRQRWVR
jgi:pantothenate synthetase